MTTDDAREAWNDLLKEMFTECGETDPNKAGVRLMMRFSEAVKCKDMEIMELRHRLKAVGAL